MPILLQLLLGTLTIVGGGTFLSRELKKAPEQGSELDTLNDGVNSAPQVAKYIAIASVAGGVVTVTKALKKGKK